MAEGELVMVLIIEDVHEICIEGVDVVQLGELIDDASQLFVDGFLHELNLPHVKLSDSLNFKSLPNDSGRLALGLGKSQVDELSGVRDLRDLLEIIIHSRNVGPKEWSIWYELIIK